jgi:hypothetical protein
MTGGRQADLAGGRGRGWGIGVHWQLPKGPGVGHSRGMASLANTPSHPADELGSAQALRLAWWAWVIMLGVPFVLFLVVVMFIRGTDAGAIHGPGTLGFTWFVIATAWLLIVVPLSFFWQSHVFRAYYSGQTVAPRDYLHGKLVVWGALELAGIFALVGCLISGSLLPNLIPALLAFMFFVPLWPNGRAMRAGTGDTDDPQAYREPR